MLNWASRLFVGMSSGQTPGKFSAKNDSSSVAEDPERQAKQDVEANRVHVNDLSIDGIAINMKERPGQMCR